MTDPMTHVRSRHDFLCRRAVDGDRSRQPHWSYHGRQKIKGGDIVSRPLATLLCAVIERQPKMSPFVFTYECQRTNGKRRKGQRYPMTATFMRRPFGNALRDASIERFRVHDLRHTCGTRIVRSTGSIAAARAALKHSSINTTLRCAHVMDEDVRNALEKSGSRTEIAWGSGALGFLRFWG